MAALRALAAEKSAAHRRGFVGQELEAITLQPPAPLAERGRTSALTENLCPSKSRAMARDRLVGVWIVGLNAEGELQANVAMAKPDQ